MSASSNVPMLLVVDPMMNAMTDPMVVMDPVVNAVVVMGAVVGDSFATAGRVMS